MSKREINPMEDDLLDRATAALRDADTPAGPEPALIDQTLLRLSQANASPTEETHSRRILTMKGIIKLAIAACIALLVGLLVFNRPPDRSSLAFGAVLDRVQNVKTLRFKMESVVQMPNGKEQVGTSVITCTESRMRHELLNSVSLTDYEKGQMLILQPRDQRATRMTMQNIPPEQRDANLLAEFRKLTAEQGKSLGTKEFDGRTLHGFEIAKGPQVMKVWADPETKLPVRIDSVMRSPTVPDATATMTEFEWNVPVDPAKLSLEIPEGYTVNDVAVDVSPANEQDLLDGLKAMATLNGGRFPDRLDTYGLADVMKTFVTTNRPASAEAAKAQQTVMTQLANKAAHGLAFILPDNGADWRYAGSGVALGEANRPILWYRVDKSTDYRVIDADLDAKTVDAANLPTVESVAVTSPAPATGNR